MKPASARGHSGSCAHHPRSATPATWVLQNGWMFSRSRSLPSNRSRISFWTRQLIGNGWKPANYYWSRHSNFAKRFVTDHRQVPHHGTTARPFSAPFRSGGILLGNIAKPLHRRPERSARRGYSGQNTSSDTGGAQPYAASCCTRQSSARPVRTASGVAREGSFASLAALRQALCDRMTLSELLAAISTSGLGPASPE